MGKKRYKISLRMFNSRSLVIYRVKHKTLKHELLAIYRRFSKILGILLKGRTKVFDHFTKITEDFREREEKGGTCLDGS